MTQGASVGWLVGWFVAASAARRRRTRCHIQAIALKTPAPPTVAMRPVTLVMPSQTVRPMSRNWSAVVVVKGHDGHGVVVPEETSKVIPLFTGRRRFFMTTASKPTVEKTPVRFDAAQRGVGGNAARVKVQATLTLGSQKSPMTAFDLEFTVGE